MAGRSTSIFIFLFSLCVFFGSWLVVDKTGINSLPIQSEDAIPSLFLPYAILKNKTLYLDSYYDMMLKKYPHPDDKSYIKGLTPFYLKKVGTHYVSAFPLVSGLVGLPVYLVVDTFNTPITWDNLAFLGHLVGAMVMALAGVYFFKLSKSKLLTFIYLFGTINYALVSQAVWQHGVVQLFLIVGAYKFFDKKYIWSGVFFGLAILSRPTAALVVGMFGLYLLYQKQITDGLKVIIGIVPSFVFFVWYTLVFYGGLQNNGYSSQVTSQWLGRFPEGFLGLWLSPSKGILVFSPIFIFALVGLYMSYKKRDNKYLLFGIIVLLHTLVLGKWKHWYGGYSFGYRMASDILPFLVLLLVPFLESSLFARYKKIFYALLVISVMVQVYGMAFFDGIWHAAYDGGYQKTGWLWSLKDSEWAFNIRRVLVKLNVLEKACPNCL